MDKKKIGILLVVLGIIVIISSGIGVTMKSDDNSNTNTTNPNENNDKDNTDTGSNEEENPTDNETDKETEEPTEKPQEKEICINDYQNANMKQVSAKVGNKTVTMKVLSCIDEQEVDGNKVKFYSKEDSKFFFEVYILNEDLKTYSDNLDKKYTDNMYGEDSYSVSVTNDSTTNSGNKYNVVNVYKKNEAGEIHYKDYNMMRNLENNELLHLRLVTTKYDLEADFIYIIEESLEIK